MKKLSCLNFVLSTLLIACGSKSDDVNPPCIKGKYEGIGCDGLIIRVLDDSNIGRDWTGIYDGREYKNSVVASLDSLRFSSATNAIDELPADSIIYFQYSPVGYARKTFNVCDPSPFITITVVSTKSCAINEAD